MGTVGTPAHKLGLVLGEASADVLARAEASPSVLVLWQSGEQEWIEPNLLRTRD